MVEFFICVLFIMCSILFLAVSEYRTRLLKVEDECATCKRHVADLHETAEQMAENSLNKTKFILDNTRDIAVLQGEIDRMASL